MRMHTHGCQMMVTEIATFGLISFIARIYTIELRGTFGGDFNLVISNSIAKLNICQLTCTMSIRQGIYTQYRSDCQTKW